MPTDPQPMLFPDSIPTIGAKTKPSQATNSRNLYGARTLREFDAPYSIALFARFYAMVL